MIFTADERGKRSGQIGKDARGMRFMILDSSNIAGNREDKYQFVVVLPGSKGYIPGSCLQHSWVDLPVSWEDGTTTP